MLHATEPASKQEEQEQAMVLSVVRLIDGGRVRDMEREWNGVQRWAMAMCLRLRESFYGNPDHGEQLIAHEKTRENLVRI